MTGENQVRSDGRRLVLYVRSLPSRGAHDQQQTILSRLSHLDAEDVIDGYSVHVWGKRVSLTSTPGRTEPGQFILERVTEFHEWARRNDLSLEPFFETRAIRSRVTDEEYTALVLPTMALAEYSDSDVRRFAPCTDGAAIHTPADLLDALAAESTAEDTTMAPDPTPARFTP